MNIFQTTKQLLGATSSDIPANAGASTVDGIAHEHIAVVGGGGGGGSVGPIEVEKQGFFEYIPYTTTNIPTTSQYFAPITPHTLETLNNLDALFLNDNDEPDDDNNDDINTNDDDDNYDDVDVDIDDGDLNTAKLDELSNSDKENYVNDKQRQSNKHDDNLGAPYATHNGLLTTSVPSLPQDSAPFMFVPVEMAMIDTSALYILSPKYNSHNDDANEPWYLPVSDDQNALASEGAFTFVPMVAGVKIIGGLPSNTDNNDNNNNDSNDKAPKEQQQSQDAQQQQEPLVDEEGKPTAFTVQQTAAMPTARAKKGTITVSKEVDGQKTFRFVPEDVADDDGYDFVPVMQTKSQPKAVLPKLEEDAGLTSSLTTAFSSVMPFAGKLFGTMSTTFTSMTKAILEESDDDDDDDDDDSKKEKQSKRRNATGTNLSNKQLPHKATHLNMPNKHHPHHGHSQSHRPGDTQRQFIKTSTATTTSAGTAAVSSAATSGAVVAVAARDGGGDMMVCTEDGQQLLVTVPQGVKKGQTFVVNY